MKDWLILGTLMRAPVVPHVRARLVRSYNMRLGF